MAKAAANRLRQVRESLKLSQIEFAAKCKLTYATIYRIESGEVTARKSTLKTIAEKIGVNELWLIEGHGKMIISPPEQQPDHRDEMIIQLRSEIATLKKIIDSLTKK